VLKPVKLGTFFETHCIGATSVCMCVSGVDAGRALQLLTQPGPYALPSFENVVSRATSNLVHRPEETPISDDQLNAILLVCTQSLELC